MGQESFAFLDKYGILHTVNKVDQAVECAKQGGLNHVTPATLPVTFDGYPALEDGTALLVQVSITTHDMHEKKLNLKDHPDICKALSRLLD